MAAKTPSKKPAGKGGFVPFEKSKFDKDPKGVKEGSKADKALDKKQKPAFLAAKGKPKK